MVGESVQVVQEGILQVVALHEVDMVRLGQTTLHWPGYEQPVLVVPVVGPDVAAPLLESGQSGAVLGVHLAGIGGGDHGQEGLAVLEGGAGGVVSGSAGREGSDDFGHETSLHVDDLLVVISYVGTIVSHQLVYLLVGLATLVLGHHAVEELADQLYILAPDVARAFVQNAHDLGGLQIREDPLLEEEGEENLVVGSRGLMGEPLAHLVVQQVTGDSDASGQGVAVRYESFYELHHCLGDHFEVRP